MNKYFLYILFVIIFVSCKKEVQTIFIESDFSTDKHTNVHINIPVAIGDISISEKINSRLIKNVSTALQIGSPENKNLKSIEESVVDFTNEFNNFKKEFPENKQQWEAQLDGEILFQSTEIITIAITSYVNTGGAHGSLNISLLNFNAESGEEIENSNLFNDIKDFKNIAKPYFEKETEDKDLLDASEDFKLPTNIGYNDEGVILIYNTYEVAPYSSGIIEFMIPFKKVNSCLVFKSSF
ncbi:MAG: DUF4163 domain-containing protein [Algibacter sp.]